ncbi:VC2046/SO_2500 family protein [Alteromonas gilva]|uniref:VC2046/SO_2500 family protein n=1 Tax=Alteromonas gilva TaxID=2987522 RepID=A0ABT5L5F4_9ALTE|nr:VC2046/SO_2500 family protein [Alteromonas gilva]MDC8830993.1 VC2046/SO_2500 family protein [Alteromonas gilva]
MHTDNSQSIDAKVLPINKELALNQAASGSNAFFKLCLALYDTHGDSAVSWRNEHETVADDDFPARLNHYRRSPLTTNESNLATYLRWQADIAASPDGHSNIKLWQAMHPDPLSFTNDSNRIPPDVKQNCAYRTQLAWLNAKREEPPTAGYDTDPTLLSSIIPGSQALQL